MQNMTAMFSVSVKKIQYDTLDHFQEGLFLIQTVY